MLREPHVTTKEFHLPSDSPGKQNGAITLLAIEMGQDKLVFYEVRMSTGEGECTNTVPSREALEWYLRGAAALCSLVGGHLGQPTIPG